MVEQGRNDGLLDNNAQAPSSTDPATSEKMCETVSMRREGSTRKRKQRQHFSTLKKRNSLNCQIRMVNDKLIVSHWRIVSGRRFHTGNFPLRF